MKIDTIKEILIDRDERLCLTPEQSEFPYIYREANEVRWDKKGKFLYSPKPKDWSYLDWYKRIINGAKLQGVQLTLSKDTVWSNILPELKQKIEEISKDS